MAEDQVGLQEVHKDHKDATVASGCMIPKSAAQLGRMCTLLSLAERAHAARTHG
jgi:hypothetical protein